MFVTLYNVICNALTLGTDPSLKNVFSYLDSCMIVLTLRVQATREEFSLPTPFHWSTIFSVASYTGLLHYFQSLCQPILSLSPAPGCQSPPPPSLFSLSDRFYMHKRWVLRALCSNRGLLLRIEACLTPVVSWHCSEWIAMCSWCLNRLNASPGHHFNGFSLGWYTLIRSIY